MSAAIEEAYGQGWHDAQEALGQRLLSLISEVDAPRPAVWQRRCQNCQETMEIGQQAEVAGRDVFNNVLYVHFICPTRVEQDQEGQEEAGAAPLSLVKPVGPMRLALAPQPAQGPVLEVVPEPVAPAAPPVLLAVASGQPGGPYIITVTNPADGSFQLARIELMHWTGFGTLGAQQQLREHGYQILPSALTARGTIGDGWTQMGPCCFTAPVTVIGEDQEPEQPEQEQDQEPDEQPEPENYLEGMTLAPVADPEPVELPVALEVEPQELPVRTPAASFTVHPLQQLQAPTFEPEMRFVGYADNAAVYQVINAVCSVDQGTLHMHTVNGRRTAVTCLTCGSEVSL